MRVLACGDRALLVELDRPDQVLPLHERLAAAAARAGDPGDFGDSGDFGAAAAMLAAVVDLVPAERTLLVQVLGGTDLRRLAGHVLGLAEAAPAEPDRAARVGDDDARLDVDVRYDGPDLAEVARATGSSIDGVVARHCAAEWTVAFCGFTPGFGYLRAPDDPLVVARRDQPRGRVPAGAVALGGHYSAIYPRESPGGWRLIGHTDAVVWDAGRPQPALLTPGTRVRFRAVR